ncbi:hypothetical protein [Hydrocarboniphaga sp.]|uniref:hypothetical protein n=1 Tax=Hydrocarboniphaga sp. TaxID=2033016 RepID=UPI002AB8464E|nr:hypothetical protein [Hydrocarboniphaga sp.]MDZ4078419.1 hypothetical protein [Hydrocarboniphaga sp.]
MKQPAKKLQREHVDTLVKAIARRIATPVNLSITHVEASDYGRIISLEHDEPMIEPSLIGRRIITAEIAENFTRLSLRHRKMLNEQAHGVPVDFEGEYFIGEFRSGPFKGTLEAQLLPSGEKHFLLDLLWQGVPTRSRINLGNAKNVVDLEPRIINSLDWGSPRGAVAAEETLELLSAEAQYPKPFVKLFAWARRTRRLSF